MRIVHFLAHHDYIGPGQLGEDVAALDHETRVHCLWEGHESLAKIAPTQPLVVLGGTMNAYADADHPWLPAVRGLLRERVTAPAPTLGICLGHQLAAVALGGQVEVAASAGEERGLTVLQWIPATSSTGGDQLDGAEILGRPPVVFSDHADAVSEVPPGARVWARSAKYPQVMTVGNLLSVQFHPEINEDVVAAWFREREPHRYDDFLAQYRAQAHLLGDTCRRLAGWLTSYEYC